MGIEPNEITKDQLLALKFASFCMDAELPKTYTELNHMLWKAFKLGAEWEQEKAKEK